MSCAKWEKPSKGESFGLWASQETKKSQLRVKTSLQSVDFKSSQCLFCWQFVLVISFRLSRPGLSLSRFPLLFLQKKCEVAPVSFKNWIWLTGPSAQYPSGLFSFLLLPSPTYTTLNGHHVGRSLSLSLSLSLQFGVFYETATFNLFTLSHECLAICFLDFVTTTIM